MIASIDASTAQTAFGRLLEISLALSGERHIDRLYEQIIDAAQEFTHADGGTLYIVRERDGQAVLSFEVMRNDTFGTRLGGSSGQPVPFAPIPLWLADGQPNLANICAYVFHHKHLVNIDDAYATQQFDFTGTRRFDEQSGYRSQSLLTIPLANHAGDVIGVLQLINARDRAQGHSIPFDRTLEPVVSALASTAAVTLDNQLLLQGHRDLLDAFIRVIAQAIDAKSSHTSTHCQRVPVLTELIARAACRASDGPLRDFQLDEAGWYELHVAAWLHDCGKLATPDSLLDKSTKLHALCDRIETVRTRFAALAAQTEAAWWRQSDRASDPADDPTLQAILASYRADCAFLEQANLGSEMMRPEDQDRVREIARHRWLDAQGEVRPMLDDEEVSMLCIVRGTLSAGERERINDHIKVTIQMLESLPFPKQLRRVPEYAGGHHERVDGRGFPRGLSRDQMSWPARMMAVADVFEALTARDRPYKLPMKLSQALSILRDMASSGHVDPALYEIFLEQRVWADYAHQYLLPDQCDVVDHAPYRLNTERA